MLRPKTVTKMLVIRVQGQLTLKYCPLGHSTDLRRQVGGGQSNLFPVKMPGNILLPTLLLSGSRRS